MYSKKTEKNFYLSYAGNEQCDPEVLNQYLESFVSDPASLFRGATVLEIGAGPAQYSRLFKSRYGARKVIAFDLVWEQLARSRGENKSSNVLGCVGDCFELPFRGSSFDIVFGSMLLHRFQEMPAVLEEAKRVMRCAGVYIGIEPSNRNPMHLMRHLVGKHSENEIWVTRHMFKNAFDTAGLDVNIHGLAPRYPWLKNIGLSTCLGIQGEKREVL